ncbi:MAG: class I SAM-dependent methyltransferase [Candidatus Margulisbacteria bacterium]|nr:class I SAM-dependent methyltransferase [Candidatus Margulisiibacteriota bacterium]
MSKKKKRTDTIWKSREVISRFLSDTQAAVPLASEQLDVMLQILTADNNEVRYFLDLGCGDGIMSRVILERFPNSRGICLDFSRLMVQKAKENLEPFSDRLHILQSDYSTKKYLSDIKNSEPFDAVVSRFSIHHQPDIRKKTLYKEIYELLENKGFFINIEHVKSSTPWVDSIWNNVFIDCLTGVESKKKKGKTREQVEYEFFNDPMWVKERKANLTSLVEDQCDWLRDIGYKNVDCFFKFLEIAVFGGQK